jgi:nitric oxide reductase large subunit
LFLASVGSLRIPSYSLLMMFIVSSIAIPLFYAAGLMYGQRSNLVTAEYWRWWVVHLWVEGTCRYSVALHEHRGPSFLATG